VHFFSPNATVQLPCADRAVCYALLQKVLQPNSNASHEEVVAEALGVRLGRVSATEVQRHRHATWRNRPRARHRRDHLAVSIVGATVAHGQSASVFHPAQAVGVLFDGEDFAGVFFDAAVAFPYAAGFARVLERGAEVGSALLAEGFLHYVQLFAVAAGDVDFDLDGAVDVADWASDATGEASAALKWCESLEGHGYSVKV